MILEYGMKNTYDVLKCQVLNDLNPKLNDNFFSWKINYLNIISKNRTKVYK